MRLIINADDCGKDARTDTHIKNLIASGKLSSTTIMANMNDFEGACNLYNHYHKIVSFGCHLNLTEGHPLINSNEMIKQGYVIEKDDGLFFNGATFRKKTLNQNLKNAIFDELNAQVLKLKKEGIKISHLDSHHHIHTSSNMFGIIAELSKRHNIPRIRRLRNWIPISINFYARQGWYYLAKLYNRSYIMSNYFCSYTEYFNNPRYHDIQKSDTIELMVHPGLSNEEYIKEEQMMLDMKNPSDIELINYNQLL